MRFSASFASLLVVALLPCVALAHAVGADAYVADDGATITVEAWFPGGHTPPSGTVIVSGEDGSEILRGELKEGEFQFRAPSRQRFRFDVQLGEGHARQFVLNEDEFVRLNPDVVNVSDATSLVTPGTAAEEVPRRSHKQASMPLRVAAGLVVIGFLTLGGHALSKRGRTV